MSCVEPEKLSDLFIEGWRMFENIEESADPSQLIQEKMGECIRTLVKCTHMVNLLSLFSSNESFDEISTENIKFLLLPGFLGELFLKVISDDRQSSVQNAKVYLEDFLKRCNEYDVSKQDLRKHYEREGAEQKKDLNTMNEERAHKIERFKKSKEITQKIKLLQERLKSSPESVDETEKREHYTDWLLLWINKSIENLPLIDSELAILEHMSQVKQGTIKPPEPKKKLLPMKPILITRDMIKNKVFGAGYQSLPTMTEDEYFEKELREGKIVMDYDKKEEVEKKDSDEETEEESEEKLQKKRAWDDWRDTHRFGEGNKSKNG